MIAYALIMFLAAAVFLILGVQVFRGKIELIHDYHRTRVQKSSRRSYGRAFSVGMFTISASMILSGVLVLVAGNATMVAVALLVLIAGLFLSIGIFASVQKKYNGGIF